MFLLNGSDNDVCNEDVQVERGNGAQLGVTRDSLVELAKMFKIAKLQMLQMDLSGRIVTFFTLTNQVLHQNVVSVRVSVTFIDLKMSGHRSEVKSY